MIILITRRISPAIDIAAAPVIAVIGGLLLGRWSGSMYWTNEKRYAMAIGMIASELLMGYFMTQHNPVDHIGHIVIMIIVLLTIVLLHKRIKTTTAEMSAARWWRMTLQQGLHL